MNMFGLILVLALTAGGIFLEIFLAKRESPLPGLVLPILFGMLSLIFPLNVVGPLTGEVLVMLAAVLLIANIPTLILLAIYWAVRGKARKKKQLDKLNIQDL
ncbi:MAG: hypothetical protein Q4F17_04825 [Eubacteriales bacterium]|nr:hypothetical protein [Eubacteriales bacterium]